MRGQFLTSSVYSFENMRNGNFLYVDKTEYIWKLIEPANAMYFLSRPRRFGKSLTLSTLKAVFQGRKELFKGLALYDKPYDWKPYPVIHLDFSNCDIQTPEELTEYLRCQLEDVARAFNVPLRDSRLSPCFERLIEDVAGDGKVVILIDEYDKPVLNNICSPQASQILQVLKGFYSNIKKTEKLQRFAFLTGVSRFSHVSVFSDLNNLTDISMHERYAAIVGYTQEELEFYFGDRIEKLVEQNNSSKSAMLAKIKEWYNGYRFEEKSTTVYNPVSLVRFFDEGGKFNTYWFQTGTPSFLLNLIKEKKFNCATDLESPVGSAFFNAFEISNIDPKILLYQTGYLTIDRSADESVPFTDRTVHLFYLHFPNKEVKYSFNDSLLEYFAAVKEQNADLLRVKLVTAAGNGKIDDFMGILRNIFANIPYDIHCREEFYYQSLFYLICYMFQVYAQAEVRTNDGRIDMTVEVGDWIYIIEFKLDKSAEEALMQIKKKNYAEKFLQKGKRIMLVGVNFDSGKGQIADWTHETL